MKLIHPLKFKMHKETLYAGNFYHFNLITDGVYGPNITDLVEENPNIPQEYSSPPSTNGIGWEVFNTILTSRLNTIDKFATKLYNISKTTYPILSKKNETNPSY